MNYPKTALSDPSRPPKVTGVFVSMTTDIKFTKPLIEIVISVWQAENGHVMIYDSQGGALPLDWHRAFLLYHALDVYLGHGENQVNEWRNAGLDNLFAPSSRETVVATRNQSGCVYLLKSNGLYKIGITQNLEARIASLQTGSPDTIEVIHTIKTSNMTMLENELHNKFESKRVRGEWFKLNDWDVEYIKGLVS